MIENPSIHVASDAQQLAQTLAEQISAILENAIASRGNATLVVSGGSTPKLLFQILSRQKLPWNSVTVTLADERCVEPDDERSNAKLVHEYLLKNDAQNAKFVSLFDGGTIGESAAIKASQRLAKIPTYDAVILGMGDDGHTASIFPKGSSRDEALHLEQHQAALLVDPVTVTPLRITQTANRLLNTRYLALHVVGESKAGLLKKILANPDETQWPIAHFVCQQTIPVSVYTDTPVET